MGMLSAGSAADSLVVGLSQLNASFVEKRPHACFLYPCVEFLDGAGKLEVMTRGFISAGEYSILIEVVS